MFPWKTHSILIGISSIHRFDQHFFHQYILGILPFSIYPKRCRYGTCVGYTRAGPFVKVRPSDSTFKANVWVVERCDVKGMGNLTIDGFGPWGEDTFVIVPYDLQNTNSSFDFAKWLTCTYIIEIMGRVQVSSSTIRKTWVSSNENDTFFLLRSLPYWLVMSTLWKCNHGPLVSIERA